MAIIIGTNYICKLCSYKTNLKVNFQLHCKTDKHLQRLNHVNHIKEGGPENEWKLRFLTSVNPVDLRCNACELQTNSPHKIQVHVTNQQHQVSAILFNHLQKMEENLLDKDVPESRCQNYKNFFFFVADFDAKKLERLSLKSFFRMVQY